MSTSAASGHHVVQLPRQKAWDKHISTKLVTGLFLVRYRSISGTLIPNLGYEALLIGHKLQDPDEKSKSHRNLL